MGAFVRSNNWSRGSTPKGTGYVVAVVFLAHRKNLAHGRTAGSAFWKEKETERKRIT